MFENVAPVLPEVALAALERAGKDKPADAVTVWQPYLSLLRSLAYDPCLFNRSSELLRRAAAQGPAHQAKHASETFVSLFTIVGSGTHATIEQRLGVIERLLKSSQHNEQVLGLTALDQVLQTARFVSAQPFEFGARTRDYGYQPQNAEDEKHWYGSALALIERLVLSESLLVTELRNLVAMNFRGLWTSAQMHDELETLSRKFASDQFWREGWMACQQTMSVDKDQLTLAIATRLSSLKSKLRPSSLSDRVRAIVLGNQYSGVDLEDIEMDSSVTSSSQRLGMIAHDLGKEVAINNKVLVELVPELFKGGVRIGPFGRGLAGASADVRATWNTLVSDLNRIPTEQRDGGVLIGFLEELAQQDGDLVQEILDSALDQPELAIFLPRLQWAVGLDEPGVARLERTLRAGLAPIWMYKHLALGQAANQLPVVMLKKLLLLIADQPEGVYVALEILSMRLFANDSQQCCDNQEILEAGRELLKHVTFQGKRDHDFYNLDEIVRACVADPHAGQLAAELTARLIQAFVSGKDHSIVNIKTLIALLQVQPQKVLDTLFAGDSTKTRVGKDMLYFRGIEMGNPADAISCETLIDWCDAEREYRYALAASFISFSCQAEHGNSLAWSDQAKALLRKAPEPRSVLEAFIKRFRPRSWSGSRAALMETYARLLESVNAHVPPDLATFVTEAKQQLKREIAIVRQWETDNHRTMDERFE